MKSTLVLPDTCRLLKFRHQIVGITDEAICTLGLECGLVLSDSGAEAVADAWGDNVMPLLSNTVTFIGLDVMAPGGTEHEISRAVVGTSSSAPMTPNVTYLAKKRTGEPGRRNRGRMYLPGVVETVVNGAGVVDGGFQTGANAALVTFLTDIAAAPTVSDGAVVLHSYTWDPDVGPDPGPPVGFPDPTPITSIVIDGRVATQRKRLR